jgi:hypothetical protein
LKSIFSFETATKGSTVKVASIKARSVIWDARNFIG